MEYWKALAGPLVRPRAKIAHREESPILGRNGQVSVHPHAKSLAGVVPEKHDLQMLWDTRKALRLEPVRYLDDEQGLLKRETQVAQLHVGQRDIPVLSVDCNDILIVIDY